MIIKLPHPSELPTTSLSFEAVFSMRATSRDFSDTPLTQAQLSQLLFAAQGSRGNDGKKTVPSAQEQYPLSVFVLIRNVYDIESGLYQFTSEDHSIIQLNSDALCKPLENAVIGEQPWVSDAAAIIVISANIQAMNHHFCNQPPLNQRGERYTYLEAGAAAQNVHLQATALNIGMVLVGGFYNDKVKAMLELPSLLEPTALLCLGPT